MNTFDSFNDNLIETIEKIKKELNKELKNIFSGQITLNFMLDIMWKIIYLHPEILQNYANIDFSQLLSEKSNNVYYELCLLIIGYHRSRIIFMNDNERSILENDSRYVNEIVKEVYIGFKLRNNIGFFLKNNPLINGDKFIYFPVPYYLLLLVIKLSKLICQSTNINGLIVNMCNKALAILSLLQDGFVDSAYAICRILIEEFIVRIVFNEYPEVITEYERFNLFALKYGIGYKFDDNFLAKFKERINKSVNNKIQFMYFGWVDVIPRYHDLVENNPYTFNGLLNFLVKKYDKNLEKYNLFDKLKYFHTMCSGYSHGSIGYSKYQILHYFEIATILVMIIPNIYTEICNEKSVEKEIDRVDILGLLNKHFEILKIIESKKSTENFEQYYKKFKNHIII